MVLNRPDMIICDIGGPLSLSTTKQRTEEWQYIRKSFHMYICAEAHGCVPLRVNVVSNDKTRQDIYFSDPQIKNIKYIQVVMYDSY